MPEPGTGQPTSSQKIAQFLQLLSKFGGTAGPAMDKMMGGGGGGSPMMMPGQVGQIGQPFSPTLPSGMKLPSAAAPMGMPSQNQPMSMPAPQMPAYSSGFEFSNPKARDAAVVTNAIQGLTSFISDYKNKQQEKTRARAEGYMSQIIAMQQAGDQEGLNLLLEDPKVVKTLEKGLEYYMPRTPGEAPSPEAMGIHGAIKKGQARLPAPNTPGGVAIPRMDPAQVAARESQRIAAEAALKKLQGDPELAAQQGLGTALSGEEARKAAKIGAGLGLSASEYANLELQDRKSLETFEMFKIDQENKLRTAAAEIQGSKDVATIHSGPLYERARIAQQLGQAQIKMRESIVKGNMAGAVKIAMQTLSNQINTLRNVAEKAKKDGNDDMASQFMKEADDAQKQYDELRKSSQYNIDDILKEILGSE